MSFGFGVGDLISVFSLSAAIAKSLSKWDVDVEFQEQHQDIELIITILQESTDLLSQADGPPPASAVAALKRCSDYSNEVVQSFREQSNKKMLLQDKNVIRRKAHSWSHSSSEREKMQNKITKMKDIVMLFHDIVSQFFNRLQLDRTIEMHKNILMMQYRIEDMQERRAKVERNTAEQSRAPSESSGDSSRLDEDDAQPKEDTKENEAHTRKPPVGNAGFPRFVFRGSIFSTPGGSDRGIWTGVQGAYDTQSAVNLVSEQTVKRCKLEDHVVKIEPITLESREDQQWQLNKQIRLLWAPNNSTRTYDTLFLVDPASLSDLLLGNSFSQLQHVMNNNRSFMTIRVTVSDPTSRLAESQQTAEKLEDDKNLTILRKAAKEAKGKQAKPKVRLLLHPQCPPRQPADNIQCHASSYCGIGAFKATCADLFSCWGAGGWEGTRWFGRNEGKGADTGFAFDTMIHLPESFLSQSAPSSISWPKSALLHRRRHPQWANTRHAAWVS